MKLHRHVRRERRHENKHDHSKDAAYRRATTWQRTWRSPAGALVLAALVAVTLTAPAYAEEPSLQVTFPQITRFNPDTTTYTIEVTSTGYEALYLMVRDEPVRQIPTNGSVTVDFAIDGPQTVVVSNVPSEYSALATSPTLEPRRTLGAQDNFNYWTGTGDITLYIPGDVDGDDGGNVAWTLSTHDGEVVRTGTTRYTQPDGPGTVGRTVIDIDGLPERTSYRLDLELDDTVAPYGVLTSQVRGYLSIDRIPPPAAAPVFASQGVLVDTFYPVADGYRDEVYLSVATSEDANDAWFEIRGPRGEFLRTEGRRCCDRTGYYDIWNGKIDGEVVAAGEYEVRAVVVDLAGNRAVSEPSVLAVSDEKLQNFRVTVTVPMASSIEKAEVGSCSRLVRPSSHGGSGSVGLLAGSKCTDPKRSGVFIQSRIDLPETFDYHYARPQIGFVGGAAKGAGYAAVIQSVPDTRGREQARRLHEGAWGLHAGPVIKKSFALRRENKTGQYYMLVNTKTVGNSRYDIQSLKVNIEIRGLR